MTPDEYTSVVCDVLDSSLDGYRSAIQYANANSNSIFSAMHKYATPGRVSHDAVFRMAVRAVILGCYVHGHPVGLFNVALPVSQANGVASAFASYFDFVGLFPYFSSAGALIQRELLSWNDKETQLPVDAPVIILYDGDKAIEEYQGSCGLESFVRKINPSAQALFYFTETPVDDMGPVSSGKTRKVVNRHELGFYVTDIPGIIRETIDE